MNIHSIRLQYFAFVVRFKERTKLLWGEVSVHRHRHHGGRETMFDTRPESERVSHVEAV